MPQTFRIVSIGDSVLWGQGLLPEQKFDVRVRAALEIQHPGEVTLQSEAHSGALIIAAGDAEPKLPGEVPTPDPSIVEQCEHFANAPDEVDLLLICGGINDVGVTTILNPFSSSPTLRHLIVRACYHDMAALLVSASRRFSKASCRILVIGYYPILSPKSDPDGATSLLRAFGLAAPLDLKEAADFLDPVIRRCEEFFAESTRQILRAIKKTGDPRIRFVPSAFTDANSVFVPATSLLWGLDVHNELAPEDPVAAERRSECAAAYPSEEQLLHRLTCYRASAGHPNVAGAEQYTRQILGALG